MRASLALGAAAALLVGAAALAQSQSSPQDSPESLLPPGFGEPAPTATAAPSTPNVQPLPSTRDGPPPAPVNGPPLALPSPSPSALPTPIDPAVLARYEMPDFARRSLDDVGVAGSAQFGVGDDAFGTADGRYVERLMRVLSAPLPSRWLSITLRRVLMSRVATPARVNGADFAAERAWLLLRMGEADAARAIVQAVDTDNYTPKLYQVAMQAALANGDPGLLCPLVDDATRVTPERGWTMAKAMCAGLTGQAGPARAQVAAARKRRVASGIDLQLAQKVIGAGANSRQAITIEWEPVTELTAWRYGLAIATGVAIPDALYETVGPQVVGWRALSPAIPIADRAAAAERAAGWGILSSAALVDLYGALDASEDTPAALSANAGDLRLAYIAGDAAGRLSAMKQLWDGGATPAARYARLVLTARAAARVRPSDNGEADRLVAAMLSAGMDRTAARWASVAPETGDAGAMLLLADPDRAGQRASYGAVSGYSGKGDSVRKQRMLFAGLAGLGRLSPDDIERGAEAFDVRIGAENAWTRALTRAAAAGQQGSVVLLAAIGMQTSDWTGVPPEALYRIVGALRAVGLEGEARMIAAEAIARL